MNFVIPVRSNLELRRIMEIDAEKFFKVTDKNRHNLRKWLPWVDNNVAVDDTRKYIQTCIEKIDKQEGLELGIWYEGQWVGTIGFHAWNKSARNACIGYWLSEDFQGKGIMRDAVRSLIKYGFEQMKLNRIEILCAVENAKSRAIPESLQFTKEGVSRQSQWLYDHFVDLVIYSLLVEEWKG